MRSIFILTAGLMAAGLAPGAAPSHAATAPLAAGQISHRATGGVETVAYWRRYCRRYGCPPPAAVVPEVDVEVPPAVVEDVPVVVPVVPLRPLSCGEFRYWNGVACVDARYNNPYIGPR